MFKPTILQRMEDNMKNFFRIIKEKCQQCYKVNIQLGDGNKPRELKVPKVLISSLSIALIIGMTSTSLTLFSYFNIKKENDLLAAVNDSNQEVLETYTDRFLGLYQDVKDLSEQSITLLTLEEELRGLNEFDPTKSVLTTQNKLALQRIADKEEFSASTITDTIEAVDVLKGSFVEQEITVNEMIALLNEKKDKVAATPSIYPTYGYITSNYGYRVDPVYGGREFHTGMDIANTHGSQVFATADGVVTAAHYAYNGYGYQVIVNHGNGFETFYGHNSRLAVKPGDYVRKGEVIAYVGRTGKTTGSHVHYEVRLYGQTTNPQTYLK